MSVYDVGTATTTNAYTCVMALPVELLMFDAAKSADRTALVQWQTQQTGPFFYQNLQRSIDGQNWETVYTEKIVQSNTSLINRVYSDKPPASPDLFYYRLQLTDENGLIKYSPIKPVQFDPLPNSVSVFPNPVKDILSVTGNSTTINKLELYDRTGRLVKSPVQPNSASATVNMSGLTNRFLYAESHLRRHDQVIQGGKALTKILGVHVHPNNYKPNLWRIKNILPIL